MRNFGIFLLGLALSGCAPTAVKLYEGEERPANQQGVVSAVGLYRERMTSLQITKINDEVVDSTRTAEFLLLPDTYRFTIHVTHDLKFKNEWISWQYVDVEVDLAVQGGHVYIPNFILNGDRVSVFFDDKGGGYKRACLPLYTQAALYGKPASGCE